MVENSAKRDDPQTRSPDIRATVFSPLATSLRDVLCHRRSFALLVFGLAAAGFAAWNTRPSGKQDPNSIHEGSHVTVSQETSVLADLDLRALARKLVGPDRVSDFKRTHVAVSIKASRQSLNESEVALYSYYTPEECRGHIIGFSYRLGTHLNGQLATSSSYNFSDVLDQDSRNLASNIEVYPVLGRPAGFDLSAATRAVATSMLTSDIVPEDLKLVLGLNRLSVVIREDEQVKKDLTVFDKFTTAAAKRLEVKDSLEFEDVATVIKDMIDKSSVVSRLAGQSQVFHNALVHAAVEAVAEKLGIVIAMPPAPVGSYSGPMFRSADRNDIQTVSDFNLIEHNARDMEYLLCLLAVHEAELVDRGIAGALTDLSDLAASVSLLRSWSEKFSVNLTLDTYQPGLVLNSEALLYGYARNALAVVDLKKDPDLTVSLERFSADYFLAARQLPDAGAFKLFLNECTEMGFDGNECELVDDYRRCSLLAVVEPNAFSGSRALAPDEIEHAHKLYDGNFPARESAKEIFDAVQYPREIRISRLPAECFPSEPKWARQELLKEYFSSWKPGIESVEYEYASQLESRGRLDAHVISVLDRLTNQRHALTPSRTADSTPALLATAEAFASETKPDEQLQQKASFGHLLAFASEALLDLGEFGQSEQLVRHCIALRETTAPDKWYLPFSKCNLAGALSGQGKDDAATQIFLDAFPELGQRAKHPNQHLKALLCCENLIERSDNDELRRRYRPRLNEYRRRQSRDAVLIRVAELRKAGDDNPLQAAVAKEQELRLVPVDDPASVQARIDGCYFAWHLAQSYSDDTSSDSYLSALARCTADLQWLKEKAPSGHTDLVVNDAEVELHRLVRPILPLEGDGWTLRSSLERIRQLAPQCSDFERTNLCVNFNDVAWKASTSAEASDLDASSAVELAVIACEFGTPEKKPVYLDTLAAAYARSGDFDKAVTTMQEALALNGDTPKFLDQFQQRLKLYESQQAYTAPQEQK